MCPCECLCESTRVHVYERMQCMQCKAVGDSVRVSPELPVPMGLLQSEGSYLGTWMALYG